MTKYETKDSGERAQFDSGMQRDTEDGKARFDLIIPLGVPYSEQFLTRVAELMGRGAVKYEDRNWEKADSEAEIARAKSSAFRHFMQWICGEEDEDHAAATVFNLLVVETTKSKLAAQEGGTDEAGPEAVADQLFGGDRSPIEQGRPTRPPWLGADVIDDDNPTPRPPTLPSAPVRMGPDMLSKRRPRQFAVDGQGVTTERIQRVVIDQEELTAFSRAISADIDRVATRMSRYLR